MIMSRNAVGNLMARYKTVLKNCSLMNTFGSLAMAGMLVLGGASGAMATNSDYTNADSVTITVDTILTPAISNQESNCNLYSSYSVGAYRVDENATLTLDGGIFSNNKADYYAAITTTVNTGSKLIVNGTNFVNNTALEGGALGLFRDGEIINATFTGNTATEDGSSYTTYGSILGGGAIALGALSQTIITDTVFTNNISGTIGGAIGTRWGGTPANLSTALLTITGCTFEGNESTSMGGAIYNAFYKSLEGDGVAISDSKFLNNSSKYGGAIYNTGYLDDTVKAAGYIVISGVSFEENTASMSGGAIYNAGQISLVDSVFTQNSASNGGAVYIGTENTESWNTCTTETTTVISVTFENVTFTNNEASASGGAIYNEAVGIINFTGTNVFSGNTANGVLNDIYNDGTINVSGNMTLDGGITGTGTTNFKADSTLTIGDNTTLSQGSLTTEAGAKLVVNSVNGITVDNATIASGSWGYLSGSTAYDATTISSDSAFLQIDSVALNGSTYTVTVSQASATEVFGSTLNSGLGALIDKAIASGVESAGVDFIKSASLQSNGGTIIEGATKIATTGAVLPGLNNVSGATVGNIAQRTAVTPSNSVITTTETSNWLAMNGDGAILPVADAGNMTQGFGIWFMPMFSHTSASGFSSGNYDYGYDTNIAGATLGADYTFAGDLRLGLAFNLGQGSSTSTGDFATTENDFDYFGVSLYGAKHFADFGLSFDMGYTVSENDMVQDATDGNLYGNVDASMFTLGLKAEYLVALDGFNVTPYAGARFNYYDVDGYDTKQNGNALFNTASSDSTVWEFPVGVTFDTTSKVGSWDMTPSLALGVKFAAGDLDAEQEVSITGVAGSSVLSSEVADAVTFQGGLGLAFAKDVCNISLNYTLDLSENVESHGVSLNLRYDF